MFVDDALMVFVDPDDAQVAVERQDEAAFVGEIDADLVTERLR